MSFGLSALTLPPHGASLVQSVLALMVRVVSFCQSKPQKNMASLGREITYLWKVEFQKIITNLGVF